MLSIRPVAPSDTTAFVRLHGRCSVDAAHGLIEASQLAFAGDGITPRRRVFVLEDTQHPGVLLGVGALSGSVGLDLPRYSYRSGVVVHASAELKMFHRANTLLLTNDHTGCAELHLPLMASADSTQAPQRLLIDAMLLHVAEQPDHFAPRLIAELPGLQFDGGGSPFWSALGRHFYAGEVPTVDAFFETPQRSHIGRLMPKHPLYSSFLGADAQACLGQRAMGARTAHDALTAQGFRFGGHLNICDAGPLLEVDVADLTTVKLSRVLEVRIGEPGAGRTCLVAPVGDGLASASLVPAALDDGALNLSATQAQALGVEAGQRVRVMPQGSFETP